MTAGARASGEAVAAPPGPGGSKESVPSRGREKHKGSSGDERLQQELLATQEQLQSLTEQHQTALEELRSANEELHSVNEVLHTVNMQLSEKVEELVESNGDLRNLFESTEIATIFLDRHLIIRGFTPAVASLYSLIPSDAGRPLNDIVSSCL